MSTGKARGIVSGSKEKVGCSKDLRPKRAPGKMLEAR